MRNRQLHNAGFSLVELLVSAAVLAIAIASIVAVLRQGRELNSTDSHRRRARAVVDSCLESAAYQYSNYANMTNSTSTVTLALDTTGLDLTGTLTVIVSLGSLTGTGNVQVVYRNIHARMQWTDRTGQIDSVVIDKRVTSL